MLGRKGALIAPFRIALAGLMALAALCLFTTQAQAAPGAYRVLMTETAPELPKELAGQVTAFPDVAKVDLVDTTAETPSAAQLATYDIVVSIGDSSYLDNEAWGNSLASYVDGGGVVVSTTYDTWDNGGAPTGRWETGGYAPFLLGDNENELTTLGSFDAASPLMSGVAPGSLETELNTTNALASGATLVASWADGRPAIAFKGRVVNISAYIGDGYGDVWNGNFGQIVVNTVRTLGKQRLTVANSNPAAGTVTSSAGGISCGTVCSADLVYQTPVSLAATSSKGFAFAGFSGACAGLACGLTMDSAKSVTANFSAFKFGKKVKRNKKNGTAVLTVNVGAPGALAVSGKKIKKRSKAAKAAGNVKLPIVPKGKALKALKATGKAKVQVKLAYTPTGGATSTLVRKVQLKLVS
ncbi:MAG: hypothetical protein QOF06_1357 [Solirubrobacterales bacterium]|jgi:hypothetical protein|nr:hypothetical protein [Solirubrobacterales bacterium]